MSATHVLVSLVGEIALLVWGIGMVHTGVLRAFGGELRRMLARGLKTRGHAVVAGLAVTTVLQSSTATALMVTSFAAEGLVGLGPALAVMLGANVGTTLIVQVMSFDVSVVYPVLIFGGLVAFRQRRSGRTHDLGRVAVGLGLMLLALHLLVDTVAPLQQVPALRDLIAAATSEPIVTLLIAALFTWAAHSSVAALLFIVSLAEAGVIATPAALVMVIGANLGSALNPLFAARGDPVRLRLPVGNLINRLAGCALALPFVEPIAEATRLVDPDPARAAVIFHTAFNLVLAIAFLPLLPPLAGTLNRLLPARFVAGDPGTPRYLDRGALDTPSVALSNASREVLRMVDVVEAMLRGSHDSFHGNDRSRIEAVSRMDDILDRLHAAIHRYLAAIDRDAVNEEEARRLNDILALTINLEHIGDIVDKNLMELAAKRIRLDLALSPEGLAEIDDMHDRLTDHLRLAVAIFMHADGRAARRLVAEKEQFRDIERTATERHFGRVRDNDAASIETSGLVLDIVRDLKRIDAHIAATAYPLLEAIGELKASRLA